VRRSSDGGFTLTDGLVVFALLVLVSMAFVPHLRVRFLLKREDSIAQDLRDLRDRLEEARLTGPDRDGDGRREYPQLGDALKTRSVQFDPVPGQPGVFESYGYYFALFFPDRNRRAVAASDPAVPADYAEVTFLLIAWPVDPGVSGFRAYLCTPPDGVLRHGIDGYPYGGPEHPPIPRVDLVDLRDGRPVARTLRDTRTQTWMPPR